MVPSSSPNDKDLDRRWGFRHVLSTHRARPHGPNPSRLGLQLNLSRIEAPALPPQDPWTRRQRSGGAGQTAVSLLLLLWDMLGQAGVISGEYADAGRVSRAVLQVGDAGCLCCLCPVWTARHAETKACRQLRRDAGWGASAAAFGRGTSVQQPPPPLPPPTVYTPIRLHQHRGGIGG